MTDTNHMQISIGSANYHIPLQPFDPNDPTPELSFRQGPGPAKWHIPVCVHGAWHSIPLWESK